MSDAAFVEIFTDGACSGNPGPGSWAALLRYRGKEKTISGYEPSTTNNRMELMAAIEGLASLKKALPVRVFTDSQYLQKGVTEWLASWKRNGWKKSDKQPVLNQDLWQRLDALIARHAVQWHWVRGHAGHAENERVDQIARSTLQNHMKAIGGSL